MTLILTEKVHMLRDFIQSQMDSRDMSARKFAELVGVSQTTITRALSFDNPPEPSLDFLKKLAAATSTDIRDLVVLAAPDAFTTEPSTEARILATYIEKLPDDLREMVDSFIFRRATSRSSEREKADE